MNHQPTRRQWMQKSAALLAALAPGAFAEEKRTMNDQREFICVTCGTQFAPTDQPPARCPICEDERQYVGWDGQRWTTLDAMQGKYRNSIQEEEPNLYSIHTDPRFGIGERAFLVRTRKGNMLWDCVSLLDPPTIQRIKELGGIAAMAISHPHYYATMVHWSRAFANVPIYLHRADRQWVMYPDRVVAHWEGTTHPLFEGLSLTNTGGHFEGFQVLHWPAGAEGRGVLLAGDQPQVCMDRRWVTFMYSYPNDIPLSAHAIHRIVESLKPLAYDRLYGAFVGRTVHADAKHAVQRSVERYLRAIGA